jgi:hypothetical protein
MAEFIVAIDHITYDVVRAEDEVTAIDLVLEGEGEEMASETCDAYITEYQASDSHAGYNMNIIHDIYDNNSLDCWISMAYIIDQAVGRSDRTQEPRATPTYTKKEVIMRSHGQTATWGTPIDIGRASGSTGWYEHLKAWWTAHQAMRRAARLTAMPLRADAAADLVAPVHARSIAMALCDLGV